MPTRRRTRPRLAAMVAAVLAAGLAGALSAASPAGAHAVLRSSTPAAGGLLERAPREVVLRLSEAPLAVGSVVRVTDSAGAVVSRGTAQVVGDEVRQALDATEAGRYRVDWRVTSSDGHPISDTFTFTVRVASAPSSTPPSSTAPAAPPPTVSTPAATRGTASGHHGSDVRAGDEFAFQHVAGTVVILLLGALGCAVSLRRSTASVRSGSSSRN